jgi:hypothetical protein
MPSTPQNLYSSPNEVSNVARKPIDSFWRGRALTLIANETRPSPRRIALSLEREAAELGRDDSPSERTVSRLIAEYKAMEPVDQGAYREFRWPDAMTCGDLEWEASAAALELLRFLSDTLHHDPEKRPLVSAVRNFWRVTLAAPQTYVGLRWAWARFMTAAETNVVFHSHVLEWWMSARQNEATPEPAVWFGEEVHPLRMFSTTSGTDLADFLEAMFGVRVTGADKDRQRTTLQIFIDELGPRWQENPATDVKGEIDTWAREQTEKAASSSAPTDAGAPRSRSRKASGSTSSRKTARKSRGS